MPIFGIVDSTDKKYPETRCIACKVHTVFLAVVLAVVVATGDRTVLSHTAKLTTNRTPH